MCVRAPKPWRATWERFEQGSSHNCNPNALDPAHGLSTVWVESGFHHENNGHNPPLSRPRTCRAAIKASQVSSQSCQGSGSSRETKTQGRQKGSPAGQKESPGREGFFSPGPHSCRKVGACPQGQTADDAPRESTFPQTESANKASCGPTRSQKGRQPQAACQAIPSNLDDPEHAIIGGARLAGLRPWERRHPGPAIYFIAG